MSRMNLNAVAELARRRYDGLRMFRAEDNQVPAYKSRASELLIDGGNRCIAVGSLVWHLPCPTNNNGSNPWSSNNPVPRAVETMQEGDRVVGFTTGKRTDQVASQITAKRTFMERGYRVTTKRGYSSVVTHDHPFMCCPPTEREGAWHRAVRADWTQVQWRKASEIPAGWYIRMGLGPYGKHHVVSDNNGYFHGLMDGDGNMTRPYGVMRYTSHQDEEGIRRFVHSHLRSNGVSGAIKEFPRKGSKAISTEWCNQEFKRRFTSRCSEPPSAEYICGYLQGIMDSDGCFTTEGKIVLVQKNVQRLHRVQQWLLLFGIRCSVYVYPPNLKHRRPCAVGRLQISGASVTHYCEAVGFRHTEKADKAKQFGKATRHQGRNWWEPVQSVVQTEKPVRFIGLTTSTDTYVSDGMYSHNSGKSVTAATLLASVLRGVPVKTRSGESIDPRLPHQMGRPLRVWIMARKFDHIGRNIYRMLFRKGLYKIVKDRDTGLLRAFDPDNEHDWAVDRAGMTLPSFPLISPGMRETIAWYRKPQREFTYFRLKPMPGQKEGTECFAFPTNADVPTGDPVDIIWVDEPPFKAEDYAEYQSRLSDLRGRIFFSARGDARNASMLDLCDRAEKQQEEYDAGLRARKDVERITFKFSDNRYIDPEEKAKRVEGWSEEERQARDLGEYGTDELRLYPHYDKSIHWAIAEHRELDDELSAVLRKRAGEPEDDWTRELILDPGTGRPGILLGSIPPPRYWFANQPYFVVYDEIYKSRQTAEMLAKLAYHKLMGYHVQRFIIDGMAARQTPMGFSGTVGDNYAKEFGKLNLRCVESAEYFTPGDPKFEARHQLLTDWMGVMGNGRPRLRIVHERCPNLVRQLERTFRQQKDGVVMERPAPGQKMDLLVCLEYWASRKPKYVMPPSTAAMNDPMHSVRKWQAEINKLFGRPANANRGINVGPPSAA